MPKKRPAQARRGRSGKIPIGLKLGFVAMLAITILALALWQRAEQKGRIALARQLAAQAQSAVLAKDHAPAILLAIQSMRLNPSGEAAQILQNEAAIRPASRTDDDGYISAFAFSPSGTLAASGSEKEVIRIWKLTTGEEVLRLPPDNCFIDSLAFSTDGSYLVSGCNYSDWRKGGISRVWDVSTGKEIAHLAHPDFGVSAVAIRPDGRLAVSGTYDGIAHVWEVSTGKEIAALVHPDVHIMYALAFSPDGEYVASGTREDHSVHVWKVSTHEQVARLVDDDSVTSVAFSPDGTYLAAGSGERGHDLRVWEVSTAKEISRMMPPAGVNSVAFSPDGRYVISGSEDLTVRVWDAMTGQELSRLANVNVKNVAFSLDGKYALAGDYYENVHKWKWPPQDMIADSCSRLNRNLTRAEWQEYIGSALPYQAVCPNLPIEPAPVPIAITTPTPY
ncbi:MAG TPA: WD40 repeat domain-containing protein [Anaerolineales bacterium]|nr:WD40 repeat domain-containing protein [Anaerolineales bacterium]